MQDFFTYTFLATLTGAVTATMLVVEFLKNLGPLKRLPTRWLVLAVAETIVIITNIATDALALKDIPLYLLNGLLVTASAIGSWQMFGENLFSTLNRKRGAPGCITSTRSRRVNC
ncbi:hypothetical protein V3F56_06920 [Moorellaceae bacterium AZ2]